MCDRVGPVPLLLHPWCSSQLPRPLSIDLLISFKLHPCQTAPPPSPRHPPPLAHAPPNRCSCCVTCTAMSHRSCRATAACSAATRRSWRRGLSPPPPRRTWRRWRGAPGRWPGASATWARPLWSSCTASRTRSTASWSSTRACRYAGTVARAAEGPLHLLCRPRVTACANPAPFCCCSACPQSHTSGPHYRAIARRRWSTL